MIRIDIPATSANLGSGFDSLGIALTMCNRVWMEEADELKITTTDKIKVPTDETNLIYWAARHLYQIAAKRCRVCISFRKTTFRWRVASAVLRRASWPVFWARTVCLARRCRRATSLTLRRRLKGTRITRARQSPAALSLLPWRASACTAFPVPVSGKISFAVMIPPFELKTEKARGVLPTEYSREDTVFNLSRSALMTASLFSGDLQNLRVAMQDRMPSAVSLGPHRKLRPGVPHELRAWLARHVCERRRPTIISMIPTEGAEEFMSACDSHLQDRGINGWRVELLHTDPQGARIIIE